MLAMLSLIEALSLTRILGSKLIKDDGKRGIKSERGEGSLRSSEITIGIQPDPRASHIRIVLGPVPLGQKTYFEF